MSSLTNQTSSTKSMSGLSDTYSTNIVCDSFQCDAQFVISPGCVISLPNNSIPDAALSTNVALLNRNPQTFTGVNNFNADTNQNAIQYYVAPSGGTSTRIRQLTTGLEIVNQNNSQFINIVSRTSGGVTVEGLRCANGNTAYIQGNVNNRVSIVGSTPPVITIAPPAGSNNFSIANTAWVNTERTTALLPYAKLAGPQTFTGIQNFNGDVKLNSFFVSNYVDLTLTTYENQFYGDIYGYRGVVCQNGFYVKNSPGPGATTYLTINSTGNLLTSGNLNAQSLTLPANSIPDSYLSSNVVLDADLLNYVALAGSQTITGFKQFSTQPIFQQGLQANQNIVCESIGGGGQQSIMVQNNAGLTIRNVAISNSINLETRTSGGANVVNLSCANGTTTTINGTLTMANGDMRFSDVGGGASFTQIYQSGTGLTITPFHNSSQIRLSTKTAGGVTVDNILCQNGNAVILQGNSGKTIEVNGNDCTIACDNFRSNAPFECGYLQLATPITGKTNFDIGYRWTIDGTAFTAWNTYIAPTCGNLYTIVWDGSGDKTLGLWSVEISVGTESTTTAIETLLCWNTISGVSRIANRTSSMSKGTADFFLAQINIIKLNFTINVTNLTGTYYLNFMSQFGAGLAINTDTSFIRFTRIA